MKIAHALLAVAALVGMGAVEAKAGDPVAGEKVFTKCMQCHRIGLGATNFYGPVLNGLIGRKAGTVPGYAYSDANKMSGIVWDATTLSSYLKHPNHDIPETDMTFPGLKSQTDIDDVIAYISQFRRDGGKN